MAVHDRSEHRDSQLFREFVFAEASGRPGLTTYINSMARKILFSGTKAVGVTITNYGQQPFNLTARREVIVSAGIWNSPQLLMVSGIGPKDTLAKFNIPVISALPSVGQNTRDSCAIKGPVFEIDAVSVGTWQQTDMYNQAVETYYKDRSGPMTNAGVDVGAFERLPASSRAKLSSKALADLAEFPSDWPEVEYIIQAADPPSSASGKSKNYASVTIRMVATTEIART